jgi:hypothetical protein
LSAIRLTDLREDIHSLKSYIEEEDFRGYDPYDALNSPFLSTLSFNRKYPRIGFIQLLKKLPVNLRPLLGIEKGYNPKGIGLFLWGYSKLYGVEKQPEYLRKTQYLLGLLDQLRCKGYSGNCWGYNFDWQSRAFYVPKYTPTIVNSSFIGHALIDTHQRTAHEQPLEMAIPIKDFILHDLTRTEENGAVCFSYTPLDRTAVHNANLLGASLLIRLYKYTGDENLRDTALASLAYSMRYQNADGSWYYAETDFQNWIDSFHTGFNLQSIFYFLEDGYGKEYQTAFKKGVAFYRKHFFLEDGTPKYFHDSVYPIDIHCPAQAIVLFSQLGRGFRGVREKVATWMINNLMDKRGFFYFQKKRAYTNKISYMRWAQAWAFHALTERLLSEKREGKNADSRYP